MKPDIAILDYSGNAYKSELDRFHHGEEQRANSVFSMVNWLGAGHQIGHSQYSSEYQPAVRRILKKIGWAEQSASAAEQIRHALEAIGYQP